MISKIWRNVAGHSRLHGVLMAAGFSGALGATHAATAAVERPKAPSFRLLAHQQISSGTKFEKTRIGGLSGLVYDKAENLFWAVSDDRGKFGEPRVYAFTLDQKLAVGGKPELKVSRVIQLNDPAKKFRVFDFEGLSLLPWGNFLISSEGDMNKKPRVQPALIEFKKKNGELVRDYPLPAEYLAETAGRQTTGVRNNFAFEGLGGDGQSTWLMASELPLVQDKDNFARVLELHQPAAWQIKPGAEWLYPLAAADLEAHLSGKDFNVSIAGVSEIQFVRDRRWWVLERAASLSVHGVGLSAQIFEIQLPEAVETAAAGATSKNARGVASKRESDRKLAKTKVFDLDTVAKANFEAMAWGPDLPNGKRLLVVMSDNNFDAGTPTHILFFEVEL